MTRAARYLLVLVVGLLGFAPPAMAQTPPPILDGGVREIHEFDLSPDGRRLAWLVSDGGRTRVYYRELFESALHVLPPLPRLSQLHWASDNRHLYALADREGDEQYHLMAFDTAMPAVPARDLTPYPGKRVVFASANTTDGSALVGINLSSASGFDLYRVPPEGAPPKLIERHPPGLVTWLITMKGELFGHVRATADGLAVDTRLPGRRDSHRFLLAEDWLVPGNAVAAGSDPLPDGTAWFVTRGAGDLATPQRMDLATGKAVESIPADGVDADRVLFDRDMKPLIVQSFPGYPSLRIFDAALRAQLQTLPLPLHSFLANASFDLAMDRLVLLFVADTGEENLVYVDRASGATQVLFHQASPLLMTQLPKTVPITFAARDRLVLHGYLTSPPNRSLSGLPLVVLVHGGPWVRDVWGFDPTVVGLALHGYAVLRVNFRGSGGYGRAFERAGIGEWGGKMQDDLTDAACWAVKQGVADPRRLAIMGGSYGGYAAVMALERTPTLFAAAVEQAGPMDLPAHLEGQAPYAKPFLAIVRAYIGGDQATQWDRSPVAHIERIERPVLAFQGVNDPRVQVGQLREFERAMRQQDKDLTAVYLRDEGHGIYYAKDFIPFLNKVVQFLDNHLKIRDGMAADTRYCAQ